MKDQRRRRRSDLILVRVWSEDNKPGEEIKTISANGGTRDGEGPEQRWYGRVQRVTDGKSHPFDSRQDLLDILNSMMFGPLQGQGTRELAGLAHAHPTIAPKE